MENAVAHPGCSDGIPARERASGFLSRTLGALLSRCFFAIFGTPD